MPVPIGITIEVPDALEALLKPRRRQQIMKRVYTAIGQRWGQEFLPQHFDARQKQYTLAKRAGQQTGLAPKEFWKSYTGRKKRKYGHTLALVWTGESKRRAQRFKVHAVGQGRNQGATVTVPTPTLNRKPGGLDMAAEVRQVLPSERANLAAYGQRTMQNILREMTRRNQRKLS